MVLPFVRDLFADVEKLPAFQRVASHLRENAGRISVSGLSPAAKALTLVLLQKACGRPLIVVVSDNRVMEEFVPVLQSFRELTGGSDVDSIVGLPSRDVLPFQNLSPHPEIQEERAVALWKIATGAVSIVVSPVAATALRLRPAEYYADLARAVKRGEALDTEPLLRHLNTVGYTAVDVVEMPGNMPCGAAFSMCIRRKLTGRCASNSLATRSSLSASSILQPSGRPIPWTKSCCFL